MLPNPLTLKQLAKETGLSVDTWRRRIKAGKIAAHLEPRKPGSEDMQYVVRREDLKRYVESRRVK